jgi:hypothetical protein
MGSTFKAKSEVVCGRPARALPTRRLVPALTSFKGALTAVNRRVGHLGRIAAPNEESKGPPARAVVGQRLAYALLEHSAGGLELLLGPPLADGRRDDLIGNPAPRELVGDPPLAPPVEVPPVLAEAAREVGVVQVARLGDLGERGLGVDRPNSPSLEQVAQLGYRAIAASERAPGDGERPLARVARLARRSAVGARRQAAWRIDGSAAATVAASSGALPF